MILVFVSCIVDFDGSRKLHTDREEKDMKMKIDLTIIECTVQIHILNNKKFRIM